MKQDFNEIDYHICDIANLWRRLLNHKVKTLGVGSIERRILCVISRNPDLTQADLAKRIEIEPQNLKRHLEKLQQNGAITIAKAGRSNKVSITKEGRMLNNKMDELAQSVRPAIFNGTKKSTLNEITKQLEIIKNNLNEIVNGIK